MGKVISRDDPGGGRGRCLARTRDGGRLPRNAKTERCAGPGPPGDPPRIGRRSSGVAQRTPCRDPTSRPGWTSGRLSNRQTTPPHLQTSTLPNFHAFLRASTLSHPDHILTLYAPHSTLHSSHHPIIQSSHLPFFHASALPRFRAFFPQTIPPISPSNPLPQLAGGGAVKRRGSRRVGCSRPSM
jgi:hypothetical protein